MTSDILTQCALCGQQYTEPRVGAASALLSIIYIYIIAASAVSPHLLLELSVELHSQVTVTVSSVET